MQCHRCLWEGPVAYLQYTNRNGDTSRTDPLCLVCRTQKRRQIRETGGTIKRLVPLTR